jgi:uncharacterized protein YndB with AHSA1/START domain
MQKITIAVIVTAPLEKAWACFTESQHITQWNYASPDWQCPRATNNLHTGGTFNFRMEPIADSSQGFDFEGVYTSVVPPSHGTAHIAYSLGDARHVTVDFNDVDGATHITETFDTEDENPIEMQRAGWQSILDTYKKYTESM